MTDSQNIEPFQAAAPISEPVANPAPSDGGKPGLIAKARRGAAWLKANRKRFFWWWVLYQALKGITTLTLIWIPIFMIWLGLRGGS